MKDVTSQFQRYREAARHLSNSCYRPKFESDWDTREDFDELSILLFKHMVLNELDIRHDLCDWLGKPCPMFRVIPTSDGIPAMINRDGMSGYWDHPKKEIGKDELSIAFIDYFDWDDLDIIDFRYIRGRIIAPAVADLDGHDVLIESIYVKIGQIEEAEQVETQQPLSAALFT